MEITYTERDSHNILQIAGAMDAIGVHEAGDTFSAAAADSHSDLIVDLKNVSFMDPSGLGLLVAALKRSRAAGRDIRIENASGQPLNLLSSLNLEKVFSIQATPSISAAASRAATWSIDRKAA